jgi:hypothetical protein
VEQGGRQARVIASEGHPELAMLRALGFRHDQTNRQYQVPVASWVREKLKDEEDRCGQHA